MTTFAVKLLSPMALREGPTPVTAFIHIPLAPLLRLVPRALRLAIRHKAIEDCKDVIREMEIETMGKEGWKSPQARSLMFARHRLGDLHLIGEPPSASKPVPNS